MPIIFVDLLPKSGCKDFFDNFLFLLVAGNQLQLSPDSPVYIGKYCMENGESSMEVMRVIELKEE